jgi:hypothetical protein
MEGKLELRTVALMVAVKDYLLVVWSEHEQADSLVAVMAQRTDIMRGKTQAAQKAALTA